MSRRAMGAITSVDNFINSWKILDISFSSNKKKSNFVYAGGHSQLDEIKVTSTARQNMTVRKGRAEDREGF